MKYSKLLKENRRLKKSLQSRPFKIAVLSNITIFSIKEILEFKLRSQGINAFVTLGGFDTVVQDSGKFKEMDVIIVFWELANIIDGFQYKAFTSKPEHVNEIVQKVQFEMDLFFENIKASSLVIFNEFSPVTFTHLSAEKGVYFKVCKDLNHYLKNKSPTPLVTLDLSRIFLEISIPRSIDLRFFYSSKSLYTVNFFVEYVEAISPLILAANGFLKKVLVVDCDNTLWNGVVGEDGLKGLEMSAKTSKGKIFEEVQHLIKKLCNQGVLLALCSKNNPEDIEEVLNDHPDLILKNENIAIKKVNWENKSDNIRNIAQSLNLGLDSIVYLDDSDFEINHIKEVLPEVVTICVPNNLYQYPGLVRNLESYFFNPSLTTEDERKSILYKEQEIRNEAQGIYSNYQTYLESVKMTLKIFENDNQFIPRWKGALR